MIDKKSPLKEKPLRQAGQSVNEALQDLIFDKLLSYWFVTGFMWALALMAWIQHWRQSPPAHVQLTIAAVVVTIFSIYRGYPIFKSAQRHKQGRDGEKVVGEFLDRLRAKGYRVYHDIPGDSWNIDHVIICDRGVYTIETKTISKPSSGSPEIIYDGKSVRVNGGRFDESSVIQSKMQAKQIKQLLKETTGFDYDVRPVVVYPGWYIEQLPSANASQVWVLNPKAIHKWIDNNPVALAPERVKLAATQIAKYVRGK